MSGIDGKDELLDVGRDPRWRGSLKFRLAFVSVVGAFAAALIYVVVRPDHPSSRAIPGATNASRSPGGTQSPGPAAGLTEVAGGCLATSAPSGTRPPAVLHYSPPPPVPWVRDWYGNGSLWVMLPPNGELPTDPHANGRVTTKFPFFRVTQGQVQVHAHRLDGPPGRFSAAVGTTDSYGEIGFVPSELSFSTPGCWRLRASVSGRAALTFTVLVEPPVVSRSELARALRLPTLRAGQTCPVSGGTPIAVGGPLGLRGIVQGVGPVRPLVGARSGRARLIRHTTHRGWLAAKTLWLSAPRYRGPFLVRVRRLDGTGPVGLALDGPHRSWLLTQAGPAINVADGYRETIGATWMKRPGCIGWQIDGLDFSHIIVVRFTR